MSGVPCAACCAVAPPGRVLCEACGPLERTEQTVRRELIGSDQTVRDGESGASIGSHDLSMVDLTKVLVKDRSGEPAMRVRIHDTWHNDVQRVEQYVMVFDYGSDEQWKFWRDPVTGEPTWPAPPEEVQRFDLHDSAARGDRSRRGERAPDRTYGGDPVALTDGGVAELRHADGSVELSSLEADAVPQGE